MISKPAVKSHTAVRPSPPQTTLGLAIHLSKSHPVSGRLSVAVMDSRWAKSQVFCSVGVRHLNGNPLVVFPLQTQRGVLQPCFFSPIATSSDLVISER